MNLLKATLFLAFVSISLFLFSQNTTKQDSKFSIGVSTGYNRGLGFQANFTALKPIESLPVHFRIGIGYTSLDPGSSSDARRIFINNATNGVPEEKGKAFDYRLDFMWETSLLNLEESYIVFGPRYSSFRAFLKELGQKKLIGLGILV